MKKIFTLIVPLIFLATSTASTAAVITGPFNNGTGSWTLIDNGDFENGFTGWSDFFFRGDFTLDTGTFISADHSAKSVPNFSFNGPGFALTHGVNVVAGQAYVLSGFINTKDMQTGTLYIDMNDVSFDFNLGQTGLSYNTDEWQFLYQTFIPNTNFLTVRLVHDGNVTSTESGYFDNIGVTLASNFAAPSLIPEPSLPALLGTGLLLMALNRRRKIRR